MSVKVVDFKYSGRMFMSGHQLVHSKLPETITESRLKEVLGEGSDGNRALYYKTSPIKINSNGVVTCFKKDLMEAKTFVQTILVEKKVKEDDEKKNAKVDVMIDPDITELDIDANDDDTEERDEP